MFYVYAIKSEKRKYVYIGQTNDIEKRVKRHNVERNRANSIARPFKLFYYEEMETREEAVRREKELKKGYCREILRKVAYDCGEVPKWLKGRVC